MAQSKIYGVNVRDSEVGAMARTVRCSHGKLPFIYLGLPVGKVMHHSSFVVNKFLARLTLRKAINWGMLTLAKSIVGSLPLYFMSLFKSPKCVLQSIENLIRKFLWINFDNKAISWISWNNTMASKDKGGLGIGSLKAKTHSILVKWWWRFANEDKALWRNFCLAIWWRWRTKSWSAQSNSRICLEKHL
ncbi:uncharacterized protein [Rutidosis leptorrhynchoides]|uniref:uncharacterized protein n=1 Tax=Rutidosis leptorrhynchoides TaxID=125765 RepID=UPI003A9989A6